MKLLLTVLFVGVGAFIIHFLKSSFIQCDNMKMHLHDCYVINEFTKNCNPSNKNLFVDYTHTYFKNSPNTNCGRGNSDECAFLKDFYQQYCDDLNEVYRENC